MSAGDAVNALFRRSILAGATNPLVRSFVDDHGMRLGGSRFVAGEDLDQAIVTLRRLDGAGFHTNTTLLGEAITDQAAVSSVVRSYVEIMDRISNEGLRTNVALKLSQLGLDLSEDLAGANLERLVLHAAERASFVRIDMEESWRVDATLRIFRTLRTRHANVGTVLQSYLYRSDAGLAGLLDLQPNLRFVKGAYREPASVAVQSLSEVGRRYVALVKQALEGGAYACVATHDAAIIAEVEQWTAARGIGRDRFEFQLLYGVRADLQRELLARGFKVLIATPFGPQWYPYLMRRMAERPANLLFVARNAFRR